MTPRNNRMEDNGGKVKSLETAFRIIDTVETLDGAGVTEVSDHVAVAKSTVHDHLQTLESNDFLCKESDGTYRVGLRFLDHGGLARSRLDLFQTSKPEVENLAEQTGELANLIVEENGLGVYIDYATGNKAVNLDTYLGKREYLHSTAFGKAILAHLPSSRVNNIIDRRGLPAETDRTITSRKRLEERLETVREKGFAVDDEERLEGLCCVAAPIRNSDKDVVGAISISGPASRLKGGRLTNELAPEVIQTANIIEINMTYS